MSRGLGRVFRPIDGKGNESAVWWFDYTVGGKRHRESSGATDKTEAQDLLRKKIGDRKDGRIIGNPGKVTITQLKDLVVRQYALDGRKSVKRVKEAYAHLEGFFGAEGKAKDVTPQRLDAYAEERLALGRARATVNQELAQLRRGFRLAVKKGLLAVLPVFDLPKVQNAREGFFEEGDLAAVLLELPNDARRDLCEFLPSTGWRRDEGRLLQWAAVDRAGETIRLASTQSKNKRPRVFPYGQSPTLKAIIERRWTERDGLYVFHINAEPIGEQGLRYAWLHACLRAGLATQDAVTKKITAHKLVHDFRRTAAREFRRAGVSEGEIMQLCGWETRAMFDRYNIIDEADLAAAVGKRYGKVTARLAPTRRPSRRVSSGATT